MRRDENLSIEDVIFSLLVWKWRVVERWRPNQQFIQKISNWIVIHLIVIPVVSDNFRCHVIQTATEWVGSLISLFGQPKISQFDMPRVIQDDVFRFNISVYEIRPVQIFKGQQSLNNKESSFPFLHFRVDSYQLKKLSSRCILHNNNEESLCFYKLMGFYYKFIVQSLSYFILILHQIQVISILF